MQRLAEDGVTLQGAPWAIIRNDRRWEGKVVEGPYLLQRAGWYYLFYSGGACCGEQCNYALGVARSRSLTGPWEKHPGNPIVVANDDWRCPGHGTIVEDSRQRTLLLYHSYTTHEFLRSGRVGVLDEVIWSAGGWPAINAGQGPSVVSALSEMCSQASDSKIDLAEFTQPALALDWQWPIGQRPAIAFASNQGRWLELSLPRDSERTEAVIGKRAPPGRYSAATVIDLTSEHGKAGRRSQCIPQRETARSERITAR